MPQNYEHINRYEREVIAQMRKNKKGWDEIGKSLGRCGSSVWREYQRNRGSNGEYFPRAADAMAEKRRHIARRPRKIAEEMADKIKEDLSKFWSPVEIMGRGLKDGYDMMAASTIYNFLKTEEGLPYSQYLRGPDKKRKSNRKKFERIHDRTMITERPEEVELRKKGGHWEGDTVRGPITSRCCVMTMVERASLFLVAAKLDEYKGACLNAAAEKEMKGLPVKTITVDNGMEFASHKKLSEMVDADIYFAHPGCPWERGLNENTNGLLRQFFPKGTNFENITEEELAYYIDLLNDRPRESLGFMTPGEVMTELMAGKDIDSIIHPENKKAA